MYVLVGGTSAAMSDKKDAVALIRWEIGRGIRYKTSVGKEVPRDKEERGSYFCKYFSMPFVKYVWLLPVLSV